MRTISALAFFGAMFATLQAQAEDVFLDYSSTEGCPNRDEFEKQVLARTPQVRFIREPHAGRFFQIVAESNGDLSVGRLTPGRGTEFGAAREVSSVRCEDVVAALAVIAALAIDPNASVEPLSPYAALTPDTPNPPQAPPLVPAAPVPAPSPIIENPRPQHPAYAPVLAPLPPVQSPNVIALSLGGHVGGALWLAPSVVPFFTVGGAIGAENRGPSRYAAAIQLFVTYSKSGAVHADNAASASFDIWTLGYEYCPLRWEIFSGLALRPCGSLEGGRLTATGQAGGRVAEAWVSHRWWGAVAESARWQLGLGDAWQSIFEVGVSEPLWHDQFVFNAEPDPVSIAKVPVLLPWVKLGLLWRLL